MPHSALGATLASLSEYTDYEIQILGYNSKGQGAASTILNGRTKGNVKFCNLLLRENSCCSILDIFIVEENWDCGLSLNERRYNDVIT